MVQVTFANVIGTPSFSMFGWPAVDVVQMIQTIFSLTHLATQVTYKSGNEILTINGNFPSFDANSDPTSARSPALSIRAKPQRGIMEATITGLNLQVAIVYPIIFRQLERPSIPYPG